MKKLLFFIFIFFPLKVFANCEIGSFYQPLDAHHNWSEQQWQNLENKLKKAQIKEIFVQWSYADGLKLYDGDNSPIVQILKISERNDLKVWLGLKLDNDFWTIHQKNIDLIKSYFKRKELFLNKMIPEITDKLSNYKSFYGWYFTEEIDDKNWLEDNKKQALIDYLKNIITICNHTNSKPIAISAFTNGKTAPRVLAGYWQDILNATNIKYLLFQDSIGAGKLSLKEFILYRDILAAHLKPQTMRIVVEAFTKNKPANSLEYAQRLKNALANQKTCKPVIFSVPDYFNESIMKEHQRILN